MDDFVVPEGVVMVDTIGLSVKDVDPARLPMKYMKVNADDSKKWAKGTLTGRSGSNSLEVSGVKSRKEFRIEGSVAMHVQGHNIVSPGDVTMLSWVAMRDAQNQLRLGMDLQRAKEVVRGMGVAVTRIDLPVLLNKPQGISTAAAINAVALTGLLAGLNTAVYVGESVYFDQHSQLEAIKLYDKLAEVTRKRGFADHGFGNPLMLLDLAARTIRMEAVYRQKQLMWLFDGRLPEPFELDPPRLAGMVGRLLEKYDLRRDIRLPLREDDLMAIPSKFRQVAMAWMHGYDVRRVLDIGDRAFGTAHGYLRAHHSLDIKGPPPVDLPERVELGEILSPANMVSVPEEILNDTDLFMHCDMNEERRRTDACAQEELNEQAA
jgi:hypothetical protein